MNKAQNDPNNKSAQIRKRLAQGWSTDAIVKDVGCTSALVYNVKARKPAKVRRKAKKPTGKVDVIALIRDLNAERERMQRALARVREIVGGLAS